MGDEELEIIKMKKMIELRKKLALKQARGAEKNPLSQIHSILTEDGRIMWEKAVSQYPSIAAKVAKLLVDLYATGRLTSPLDSRDVYAIFAEIGYPIRIDYKITYRKKGEVKTISELLKEG